MNSTQQRSDGKFLVNFLHSFTDKQIFFSVWAVIAGSFVLLLVSYYRRQTRSNFRRPGDGPGRRIRVDARQLNQPKSTSHSVTVGRGEGLRPGKDINRKG